jgi:hypothetical protein
VAVAMKLTNSLALTSNGQQSIALVNTVFGTWKVYSVSNVTFCAEFKYAIRSFLLPTVFV